MSVELVDLRVDIEGNVVGHESWEGFAPYHGEAAFPVLVDLAHDDGWIPAYATWLGYPGGTVLTMRRGNVVGLLGLLHLDQDGLVVVSDSIFEVHRDGVEVLAERLGTGETILAMCAQPYPAERNADRTFLLGTLGGGPVSSEPPPYIVHEDDPPELGSMMTFPEWPKATYQFAAFPDLDDEVWVLVHDAVEDDQVSVEAPAEVPLPPVGSYRLVDPAEFTIKVLVDHEPFWPEIRLREGQGKILDRYLSIEPGPHARELAAEVGVVLAAEIELTPYGAPRAQLVENLGDLIRRLLPLPGEDATS